MSDEHTRDGVFHAIVAVTTNDGERFEHEVEMAEGRGEHQLSQEKLKRKFDNTAARALPTDRVAQAYDTILAFDDAESIHQLTGLLATAPDKVEQAAE